MKSIKILSLCLAMSLALLSSGCQKDDNTTAHTSSQGRYDWAFSETEESSEIDPFFFSMNIFLDPVLINGEDTTEANPIISYDGSPLELRYSYTHKSEIPVNVTVLFTINGVIQPFRLEGEEEQRTFYQFEALEMTNVRPAFYIDQPLILSSSEPSLVMTHFLANYDYPIDQPSHDPVICLEAFSPVYVQAEESSSPTKPQLDIVPLEQLEYHIEDLSFMEEEQKHSPFSHYGIFQNELPLVSNQFQFEYYIEGSSEDAFYLALCKDEGSYRTVILKDGEPIPAFDGKTYLDWNSAGQNQGIQVKLDSSAFEESPHNYYALTTRIDTIPSAQPVAFDEMASKPMTIAMEK